MPSKTLFGTLWPRRGATPVPLPVAEIQTDTSRPVAALPSSVRLPEAADVFIAGGRPHFTMIDRTQSVSFAAIAAQVRRRGRVISFHGVAKSGKTILCLQIFRDARLVEIHARYAKTLQAFWSTLREKLRLPARAIVASESVSDHSAEISVESSVEMNILGVGGKLSPKVASKSAAATGRSVTHEFEHSTDSQVIEALVRDQAVIVIDDFHWIADPVQAEILRDLRPFLLRNGTLVVISVPERAEQVLAHDHEMSALCTVVEAPPWDLDEIADIGHKGFFSLNVTLDIAQLRKMAAIGHHNPMLMQEACYQLCCHMGIPHRQPAERHLNVTASDLKTVFRATAKQQSRPQYREIAEGKAPKSWRTRSRKDVTIYTLCLLGMRHIGFKQNIGLEKLVDRINGIIGPRGKAPDRGTVKRALQQLSSDMRKALGDNAPLEYDPKNERVYFLDPFFMTYIQWVLAPEVGETEPAVR